MIGGAAQADLAVLVCLLFVMTSSPYSLPQLLIIYVRRRLFPPVKENLKRDLIEVDKHESMQC